MHKKAVTLCPDQFAITTYKTFSDMITLNLAKDKIAVLEWHDHFESCKG